MTKETYYAVRIGTPGRNRPYFMLRDFGTTPWLFHNERDARDAAADLQAHVKVVKVEVRELKT